MTPRAIDKTLVVCQCHRRICLQVIYGQTVRATCDCGNTISVSFPKYFADRKSELRYLIDQGAANRWEAIGIEFFIDELYELEKII